MLLLRILPRKLVSRLMGCAAGSSWSRLFISLYAQHYGIDVEEAHLPLKRYKSLTDFFIRYLKPGSRPVDSGEDVVISPVDGVISEAGRIDQGLLLQAKGVYYTVQQLLGSDSAAERFLNGHFISIYLSPRDYHRIHCPVQAQVSGITYVPGTLFPVNPLGVRAVKGLFARNERLISFLYSAVGAIALVKVGAIMVGSVKVNYSTLTTNTRTARIISEKFQDGPEFAKGQELGWFEFGSTVILLFESERIKLMVDRGTRIKMGQAIARLSEH